MRQRTLTNGCISPDSSRTTFQWIRLLTPTSDSLRIRLHSTVARDGGANRREAFENSLYSDLTVTYRICVHVCVYRHPLSDIIILKNKWRCGKAAIQSLSRERPLRAQMLLCAGGKTHKIFVALLYEYIYVYDRQ